MKIALYGLVILAILNGSFAVPAKTSLKEVQPLDMFNTYLQAPEYIQGIVTKFFTFLTLGSQIDTISFQNFTYDHTYLFREGESHTFNPTLSGLSGMTLKMTIDNDTKEVQMDVKIPRATFSGLYDLYVVNIGWPFPGDTYFRGAGEFNHTFYDVNFAINYTFHEDGGRVRAIDVSPLLTFGYCTLWAENYTIGSFPADWVSISKEFKVKFDDAKPKYDVILKDSITWALNVPWGVMNTDMDLVLSLLHTIAGYWPEGRQSIQKELTADNVQTHEAEVQPLDLFNTFLNSPEFIQGVLTKFFTFLILGSEGGSISLQNYTYNHNYFFVEGESHTFNPTLSGLSEMELTMKIDNDTKHVMMDVFVPEVIFQGQYDLWVDTTSIFPGTTEYRGEGDFLHRFFDLHFAISYTLAEEDGRVKAKRVSTLLEFTQCILWAENYTINGRLIEDFFEISRKWKTNFDNAKPKYDVILQESVAWALNVPWGVKEFSMDQVLYLLHGLDGSGSKLE